MMNLMQTPLMGEAMFGWHLHMVFGGIAITGAVLFIIWALKTLRNDELKTWMIWLLIIGIIGTFLTGGMGLQGWNTMMGAF